MAKRHLKHTIFLNFDCILAALFAIAFIGLFLIKDECFKISEQTVPAGTYNGQPIDGKIVDWLCF